MISEKKKVWGTSFTYHQNYHKEQVESTDLDSTLLKRMLKYLLPYRNYLILSIVFLMISKAIEAVVPILIGSLTQHILDSRDLALTSEKEAILSQVVSTSFMIMGLLATSYIFELINVFLRSWIGQKALYTLRTEVFKHIQTMPVAYFDKNPVGRLMTRTIHDIDQIDQMFSESVVPLIGNILLLTCIFLGITWMNWKLALILFSILPLVWWLTQRFRYYQRQCFEMIRSILSAMNGFMQEHLMGASTVRLFGLQKQEKRKFDDINEDYRTANVESIHNFSFFFAAIEFLNNIVLIAVFAYLVLSLFPGEPFQAGTFFAFSLYALMVFRPIADLAERYNLLQSAIAASKRVFYVLDEKSEILEESGKEHLGEIEEISFEDVWFAYSDDNWILKGVSFTLPKGKTLAIVGITGSGKTTILSLLLRFYEIQKGRILINGRSIQDYSLHSLRAKFSIVLQDPVIFSGTIESNISLYQPEVDVPQVEEAVDYVNLGSFIHRFPDGIQHVLSERGTGLSAGERQLISLARAVAHHGQVLILDEATANIDVGTEQVIQKALDKMLTHKTSLVIAHRLSTVQRADEILVMHHGIIKERGSHQALISLKGIYEKLYRLQFQNGWNSVNL